jgi:hypothetical protein
MKSFQMTGLYWFALFATEQLTKEQGYLRDK